MLGISSEGSIAPCRRVQLSMKPISPTAKENLSIVQNRMGNDRKNQSLDVPSTGIHSRGEVRPCGEGEIPTLELLPADCRRRDGGIRLGLCIWDKRKLYLSCAPRR